MRSSARKVELASVDDLFSTEESRQDAVREKVMEQKRTWIYCRIAYNGTDSAEILAAQRLSLDAYAKEHGFEIVGCSNDIESGLTMDRPGLRDFHAAVKDREVDILLIHSLTRLGRNSEKIIKYWHLLRNLDVSVHTVDCGEVDLSLYHSMLCGLIEEMRKYRTKI